MRNIEDDLIVIQQPRKRYWIYAIRFGGVVKIGTTNDPGVRLRALPGRVLQPPDLDTSDVEPLCAVPGDADTERMLHTLFETYRVIGEWFELPANVVDRLRRSSSDEERARVFALRDMPISGGLELVSDRQVIDF